MIKTKLEMEFKVIEGKKFGLSLRNQGKSNRRSKNSYGRVITRNILPQMQEI